MFVSKRFFLSPSDWVLNILSAAGRRRVRLQRDRGVPENCRQGSASRKDYLLREYVERIVFLIIWRCAQSILASFSSLFRFNSPQKCSAHKLLRHLAAKEQDIGLQVKTKKEGVKRRLNISRNLLLCVCWKCKYEVCWSCSEVWDILCQTIKQLNICLFTDSDFFLEIWPYISFFGGNQMWHKLLLHAESWKYVRRSSWSTLRLEKERNC